MTHVIHTRWIGGGSGYRAQAQGAAASSTSSEQAAAERCAMKLFRVPGDIYRTPFESTGIKLQPIATSSAAQSRGTWLASR